MLLLFENIQLPWYFNPIHSYNLHLMSPQFAMLFSMNMDVRLLQKKSEDGEMIESKLQLDLKPPTQEGQNEGHLQTECNFSTACHSIRHFPASLCCIPD